MDGLFAADDMDDAEDGDWRNLLEAMWKKVPEIEPADPAAPSSTGSAIGDAADAHAKPAPGGLTLGDVVGDDADAEQRPGSARGSPEGGAPPEPAADAAPGGGADAGREAAPREPPVHATAGTAGGRGGADKGVGSILGGLAVDELAEEGADTNWGSSILRLLELPGGHEEGKRGADIAATDFVGSDPVEIEDDSADEAAECALSDEGVQPAPANPFHTGSEDPRQVPRGRSTATTSAVHAFGVSLAQMTATKSAPSKPARPLRDPALPGLAYQKRSALPLGSAALPWPKVARSGGSGPAAPAVLMAASTKAPPPRPPSRGVSVDEDSGGTRPEEQAGQYDTQYIVVDFVDVGTTFAQEVLGQAADGDCPFDWKGVRDCVRHLQGQLGLKVVGIITENLLGSEMASQEKYRLPFDIRMMCDSVQTAESLEGASCQLTVTCAHKRNCRFITDVMWEQVEELDDGCRSWFQDRRGLLQMQYAFDSDDGSFSIADEGTQA